MVRNDGRPRHLRPDPVDFGGAAVNGVAGKRVLVTGGTGSLGQAIVRRVLDEAASVTVLSRDESKQYEMKRALSSVQFRIGDIGDFHAVATALRDIDVVVHAAAMKHVPACEASPLVAVQANIIGSGNIV